MHVLAGVSQVGALVRRLEDADLAASLGEGAEVAACRLVSLFEGDDGVCAARDGGAGHDAHGGTGFDLTLVDVARGDFADDTQHEGLSFGGARRVGGTNGVTVHRRVIEGRDGQGRRNVFGEDLTQRLGERLRLRLQAVDDVEDALSGLLDADHAVSRVVVMVVVQRSLTARHVVVRSLVSMCVHGIVVLRPEIFIIVWAVGVSNWRLLDTPRFGRYGC